MHVDAVRASVELRRAKLHEVQQTTVDRRLGQVLVEGIHGVVDARCRGGVLEARMHQGVMCVVRVD